MSQKFLNIVEIQLAIQPPETAEIAPERSISDPPLQKISHDATNHDSKTLYTEFRNKAAKYWPQGHCFQKAALCPWRI